MSRVGLLLPAGRNRELIERALTSNHIDVEVVAAEQVATTLVDLVLAEPRSLLRALTAGGLTGADLTSSDTGAGRCPPIMLLARATERPALPASVISAAVEIVTVPAPQRELLDRINRLAARQREAADERRSMREHVAHINHELRTPLQAVLGYTELMRDESLDPGQTQLLGHINSAGARMLGLVDELLDRSRAEAGHRPDSVTAMDPSAAIDAAIAAVRPLADQRGLVVTVRVAPGPTPAVCADPVHAHRVLTNLLSNAIKYNRENGRIDIRLRVEAAHVAVDITDTGAGMAADELERIFQPYERLPGTTAAGTGLGLPYARLLAQRMGGAITVESQAGHGSTFTFTLPRTPE